MSQSGWLKTRLAARYAGVSVDQFEKFIDDGLPYSQPRKTRLFKINDIDSFLEGHKVTKPGKAEEIADDIIASMIRERA